MRHKGKLTLDSVSCKDCVLLHYGSSCPLPPLPWGKARALTPLAADWFRGVPSPYHPSLLFAHSLPLLASLPFSVPLSVPFPGYSPRPPCYWSNCLVLLLSSPCLVSLPTVPAVLTLCPQDPPQSICAIVVSESGHGAMGWGHLETEGGAST